MIREITFIISSEKHPINSYIESWCVEHSNDFEIDIIRDPAKSNGGDICFLISCNEIVSKDILDKYEFSLVIHASDLPHGRGWSPHIWSIINGDEEIVISLLEASRRVDEGDIWKKIRIDVGKYSLNKEIIRLINEAHIDLINFAIKNYKDVNPQPQDKSLTPTYFQKRNPSDSRISVDKTIREQFNLIRICDPDRFPAFFELDGHKFKMIVEKYDDE